MRKRLLYILTPVVLTIALPIGAYSLQEYHSPWLERITVSKDYVPQGETCTIWIYLFDSNFHNTTHITNPSVENTDVSDFTFKKQTGIVGNTLKYDKELDGVYIPIKINNALNAGGDVISIRYSFDVGGESYSNKYSYYIAEANSPTPSTDPNADPFSPYTNPNAGYELPEGTVRPPTEADLAEHPNRSEYEAGLAGVYALEWYASQNPFYHAGSPDDANFVSQCLDAGMLQTTKEWFYINTPNNEGTDAWRLPYAQYSYFSNPENNFCAGDVITTSNDETLATALANATSEHTPIQVGDLVYFAPKGTSPEAINHVAFITKVDDSTIYFASHSSPLFDYDVRNVLSTQDLYIVRLKEATRE